MKQNCKGDMTCRETYAQKSVKRNDDLKIITNEANWKKELWIDNTESQMNKSQSL